MKEKNDKDILIDSLIDCLDIENEFFNIVSHVLNYELDEILGKKDLNMLSDYCENNMKSYAKKRKNKYKEFYNSFNEDELSDIILFHKSEAGKKLKNISYLLSQINQKTLIDAMEDKNLNLIINKLIDKKK